MVWREFRSKWPLHIYGQDAEHWNSSWYSYKWKKRVWILLDTSEVPDTVDCNILTHPLGSWKGIKGTPLSCYLSFSKNVCIRYSYRDLLARSLWSTWGFHIMFSFIWWKALNKQCSGWLFCWWHSHTSSSETWWPKNSRCCGQLLHHLEFFFFN